MSAFDPLLTFSLAALSADCIAELLIEVVVTL